MNNRPLTGRQPDSGQPTARDERGACGNEETAKSGPKVASAVFIPDSPIPWSRMAHRSGVLGSKSSERSTPLTVKTILAPSGYRAMGAFYRRPGRVSASPMKRSWTAVFGSRSSASPPRSGVSTKRPSARRSRRGVLADKPAKRPAYQLGTARRPETQRRMVCLLTVITRVTRLCGATDRQGPTRPDSALIDSIGLESETPMAAIGGNEVKPPDAILPAALRIAVLVPCYNEAGAIGKVVADFRRALPQATVFVYDNNSTDGSIAEAKATGAVVRSERRQGKGFVVRRMFADIEADIYVMVDGDDTYEPEAAPGMIRRLIADNLDMVNGERVGNDARAYRCGHVMGNRLLTGLVRLLFADEFRDMLSGYRVFSRRFVKSFPLLSGGFEIETELTVHALELQMPTAEEPAPYRERAAGTASKLRTYSDGIRILWLILKLLKQERPMRTFGWIGLALVLVSLVIAYPLLDEYLRTGLVPRFPTAILTTGLAVSGFLSITCGLILDTVTRGRQEAKRMRYLEIPSVAARLESAEPARRAETQ